jgi:hypothetical protein
MAVVLQLAKGSLEAGDLIGVFQQEWPELDLFRWTDGEDKAGWMSEHAHIWHVWSNGRLVGYFAAVDLGRGRWSVHFGSRRSIQVGREMLMAWRKIEQIAEVNAVRMMVAYIPPGRPDIQRAARIFKFRKFSQALWALNLRQNSNRPRKRPPLSHPKTRA